MNNTKYFEDLTELDIIKARYKDLAKMHHPDLGGCVEIMKEVNTQYDKVLEGHYQRSGKSITEIEELLQEDHQIRNKLCEILGYPNLIVELCGAWIWVTGETKVVKDILKNAGFFWASKKEAWYWRKKEDGARRRGGNCSMEKIRETHGSTKITDMKRTYKIA